MSDIPTVTDEDGIQRLAGPIFEYDSINLEKNETRFLVLQPCSGDKEAPENYVKCTLEVQQLTQAEPFVAIKNARGYRLLETPIEINGKYTLASVALEKFLRHYRKSDVPVRLWLRYLCVNQLDAEEQSHQWTRQWVDKMYEMAQSVVDMQPFLRDLQDQGVFQHAVHSRYAEWTKQWDGAPKTFTLPRIFPNRLGSKPIEGQPIGMYQYVPLDTVADETRIAVVAGNPDPGAPLSIYLAHCPVVSEVVYHALSHTWGSEAETCEITVTGQKMHIRKNLERALCHIRSPTRGFAIWVDALAINRSDLSERNHQIDRAARIYDRAACVVCYVGDSDNYSDLALDFVKQLSKEPMVRCDKDGNWEIGKPERISATKVPEFCAALYLFLTRPYFRRVWIIQEIALASNPVIACGPRVDVSFELLDNATHNLYDMVSRDEGLCENMKKFAPEIKEVNPDELFFIRKLFYFRHLQTGGVRHGWRKADVKASSPGYLETAILARNFQATLHHDKIFALWNVAQDNNGLDFSMDYSTTYEKTCMDFVKAWCKHSGTLDMIGASEFAPLTDGNRFYGKASSWTPDWSVPSQASSLIRREVFRMTSMEYMDDIDGKIYWADGDVRQESGTDKFFVFDGDALHCTGVILDRIKGMMLSDPEDSTVISKINGLILASEQFYATCDRNPYDDVAQAVIAMIHGDVITAWPKREENVENAREDYPDEKHVCIPYKPRFGREQMPNASRHVPYYGGSYSRGEAFDAVRTIMRGRAAFITEKHYLGLMPVYAAPAESESKTLLLAILATCSVPVLLEDHPEVKGAYRFVGTCFVQGWMEGEVLKEEMGCDEPADFWQALEGTEKLKII